MCDTPIERRRRLLGFRAARRGFREADAIFGAFAALHLPHLGETELEQFEALWDVPDHDVYDWLSGHVPVPPAHDTRVFARLRALCNRTNPVWSV
jgi:antitoxin CptB